MIIVDAEWTVLSVLSTKWRSVDLFYYLSSLNSIWRRYQALYQVFNLYCALLKTEMRFSSSFMRTTAVWRFSGFHLLFFCYAFLLFSPFAQGFWVVAFLSFVWHIKSHTCRQVHTGHRSRVKRWHFSVNLQCDVKTYRINNINWPQLELPLILNSR